MQVYGKKKYKKKQIEQEIKWNHNTCNVPTLLLGLDLETDVQFPLVVPSRTNKQIQHLHSLLFFFLQFYSFYLFIFYSEYKTKPLQKVNKIITLKKHYKTKSFHIKFRCMLLRLEPQKLPINIETFTIAINKPLSKRETKLHLHSDKH